MPTNPEIKTLNDLNRLKGSGFGKPPPRHGLPLLHWFASEYVHFTSESTFVPIYDPRNEDFGFHSFENHPLHDGSRLLPVSYQPYYIVGNLNSPGSHSLPDYVREDYTGDLDNSNTDRIIVSRNLERIYVTEHVDQKNFGPRATYRISNLLLNIIGRRDMNDFLSEMGYYETPIATPTYLIESLIDDYEPSTDSNQDFYLDVPEEQETASPGPPVETPRSFWDYCTIL